MINIRTSKHMLREINSMELIRLAEADPDIFVLDADLMSSSGLKAFAGKYPDRAVNCGIQEANMMGVAGGLSAVGFIPVVHSFAAYAVRRTLDQIFMAGCYNQQNIKIIGTDPGVCSAANGGTHMTFEDIAIMRALPGITIVDPTDEVMLKSLLPQIIQAHGVAYIRLFRKNKRVIYRDDTEFTLGKAQVVRPGTDITIIAEGPLMVFEAIQAAEKLEAQGISAQVVDVVSLKPLDEQLILETAAKTGAVLTAENHSITGGLGSAVAELLADHRLGIPFGRIGFPEMVGETGTVDYILQRFGMTHAEIAAHAITLVGEKDEQ